MGNNILVVFSTASWILVFIGIYMVAIVALGLFYSRRVEESDDLVVAGRKLNFIFMVPSILATWICAGAMMGAAGYAYLYGMQGVIFDPWAPALCMFLIAIFFASRMRRARYTTVTDFFNARYDRRVGFLYTIIQILSALAWLGGQLVALGIIVYLTTGFDKSYAIIIATLVIIVVTCTGGLWALSRVDAIGFILIVVGLAIMVPYVLETVGGLENFWATAQNLEGLPTWALTPVKGEEGYLWYTGIWAILLYISAWAALSLGDTPSQVLMQRALAAKDEKTAVSGFFAGGVLYLLIGLIPVMIGIAVFTSGQLVTTADQAENVLPWAAYNFLPPWAGVLFIVALAAAIISTSGNNTLVISTLIGHNIYRNIRPQAGGGQVLKVVRFCIPVVSIVAMFIAIYFETVYKLIIFSGGIQLATVFAAYALGYFWKKANVTGAIASFVSGTVTWLSIYGIFLMRYGIDGEDAIFMALVPAVIVSLVTLVAVSLATQKRDPARALPAPENLRRSGTA